MPAPVLTLDVAHLRALAGVDLHHVVGDRFLGEGIGLVVVNQRHLRVLLGDDQHVGKGRQTRRQRGRERAERQFDRDVGRDVEQRAGRPERAVQRRELAVAVRHAGRRT